MKKRILPLLIAACSLFGFNASAQTGSTEIVKQKHVGSADFGFFYGKDYSEETTMDLGSKVTHQFGISGGARYTYMNMISIGPELDWTIEASGPGDGPYYRSLRLAGSFNTLFSTQNWILSPYGYIGKTSGFEDTNSGSLQHNIGGYGAIFGWQTSSHRLTLRYTRSNFTEDVDGTPQMWEHKRDAIHLIFGYKFLRDKDPELPKE